MKYLNIYQRVSRVVLSALLSVGVLTASLSTQAVEEIYEPSQKPISLIEGILPNILFTFDDSGSMAWAFTPDSISGYRTYRASRSHHFNAQYYDPNVVYQVPKKVTYNNEQLYTEDYPTPSFNSAPTDGFSGSDKVDLSRYYVAQWYYESQWSGWVSCSDNCPIRYVWRNGNLYQASRAYYYDYTCGSGTSTNNNCYTHRFVQGAEQEKNFAIWYSFYRNRLLATKSAASIAFSKTSEDVRLTWGALNTCAIGTNKTSCMNNKFDQFKDQHRENFHAWLDALDWTGSTPSHRAMMRAGELMKEPDSYTRDADNKPYTCQANYHMFMTDGMWNQRPDSESLKGNADYKNITLPDDAEYNRSANYARPYSDSGEDTLADLAFYYWATDLLPDTDNDIKPYIRFPSANKEEEYWDPRNDPSTWQNLVTFTVGLGLSNSLTRNDSPTWNASHSTPTFANINELKNLGVNGKTWPSVSNSNNNNVYDLWHAAINSRGEFFSADSPDSMVEAFQKVLASISSRKTTGPGSISSGVGDEGIGYAYQTISDASNKWAGDLIAITKVLNTDGSVNVSEIWNAQKLLDAKSPASRNIKIAKNESLVDFTWSNLAPGQQAVLNNEPSPGGGYDGLGSKRLGFLRGGRTDEGTDFRTRYSVLGDIVNSKPVAVRGARYLVRQANRIEGSESEYHKYVAQQASRTPMVYVGANDGMLHGFYADSGEEAFAFIPSAVIPNLSKLTALGYGNAVHQFFVDGSPTVADVFIDNEWRTVLVGTLGAGGKGIFALDVTEPGTPSDTNSPVSFKLLWEFNEDKLESSDVKLGYSYSKPTIARLHNGKWAVVVGNGYAASGSTNGKASLLIIDMKTGELTEELVVEGTDGVANGMSTPKLADVNGDGIADFAYAGDLQGHVWRFDLARAAGTDHLNDPFKRTMNPRQGESVTFQVSFGGKPLFSAVDSTGSRQPITAAPSIVRHPTGKGYIIAVGTGRYHAEGDKDGVTGSQQSIYGIWDPTTKEPRSANKTGFPFATVTRANLQEQQMELENTVVENGKEARVLSNHSVNWAHKTDTGWVATASNKAGWYFDLVLNKEMIVADMLQFGRTLIFQSLVPDADPCASGVANWAYAINPATGGRTLHHIWADYRVKDSNQVITAIKILGEGGISIGQRPDKKYELCTGSTCEEITPDPASIGRQSWRLVEGR